MKPVLDIKPIALPAGTVHVVEDGQGLQVTGIRGALWITQAGDVRDVVLTRGQWFVLDRNGRTVVYALSEAALVVGPAGSITPTDATAPEGAQWRTAAKAHSGGRHVVPPLRGQGA